MAPNQEGAHSIIGNPVWRNLAHSTGAVFVAVLREAAKRGLPTLNVPALRVVVADEAKDQLPAVPEPRAVLLHFHRRRRLWGRKATAVASPSFYSSVSGGVAVESAYGATRGIEISAFVAVTNPGGNSPINVKVCLLLLLSLAPACGSLAADSFTDLKGNWKGVWNIDGTNHLRFYLKITKSGAAYSGAMDDLDEGYNNLPAASISNNPPSVRFDFSNVGYLYDGLVNSNFTQITGTWSNGAESWPLTFDRQPGVDEMQARTYSDANGSLPYRLFVPANYDPGRKYPLVLFLHGAGERGTDNRLQITGQSGVLAFLFNENQAKQPCFLAAPQCPTGGNWVDSVRRPQLVGLIAALKSAFNLDAERVYVTGLSLGGAGTWDLLALNGTLFAAGIPLSGYPGTLTASATAAAAYRIPIWNFHAADDATVAVSNSRNLVGAIRNLGGTPVYTEYASGGHVIWSAAYATPLLFDWMMAQKRGAPTNVPPFVAIQSPSDQPSRMTARGTVSLAGIAGDATARVSRVAWANNRGGSGTATGTNSWSVPAVPLQLGANLITIMATGTAWVLAYGGNTTFSDVIQIQRIVPPMLVVTRTNGVVTISWFGGVAPYSLERSTNIASGTWETILTTNTNSAGIPTDQTEAYFRVSSQ